MKYVRLKNVYIYISEFICEQNYVLGTYVLGTVTSASQVCHLQEVLVLFIVFYLNSRHHIKKTTKNK